MTTYLNAIASKQNSYWSEIVEELVEYDDEIIDNIARENKSVFEVDEKYIQFLTTHKEEVKSKLVLPTPLIASFDGKNLVVEIKPKRKPRSTGVVRATKEPCKLADKALSVQEWLETSTKLVRSIESSNVAGCRSGLVNKDVPILIQKGCLEFTREHPNWWQDEAFMNFLHYGWTNKLKVYEKSRCATCSVYPKQNEPLTVLNSNFLAFAVWHSHPDLPELSGSTPTGMFPFDHQIKTRWNDWMKCKDL